MSYKKVYRDGKPLHVMRPADAARAVEMARAAVGLECPDLFEKIEQECGPLRRVGFLGRFYFSPKAVVINDQGEYLGELEPGDLFSHILD